MKIAHPKPMFGKTKLSKPMGNPSSLLTGLVSYWGLDEASGTRVDLHGTNHLTDSSSPFSNVGQAVGKVSNAAQFDGSSYLSHVSNADLQCGDVDYTFGFWMRPDSLPGGTLSRSLIAKDTGSPANSRDYTIDICNNGAGLVQFRYYLSGGYPPGGGSIVFHSKNLLSAPNAWYFVVAWHDTLANTINMQVNNETPESSSDNTLFDG
jgi:hypothetical protein